jgi:hypothetical protein
MTCSYETERIAEDRDRLVHNPEVAAERRLACVPRKRARLPRNCHGPVTSPALHTAPAGDAVRRFAQVSGTAESLWDTAGKRLESDWGSSGRRFKSCQPDQSYRRSVVVFGVPEIGPVPTRSLSSGISCPLADGCTRAERA